MSELFKGLKVVDAASFLAGPCAATIMSDYGADVVKVEPLKGDRHRSIAAGHPSDFSWQLTSRNKRGLALDITTQDGYDVLMSMLEQADVFLVNFSRGQIERFKLGWDHLRTVNPKLIYAQISGYGLEGDEADRKAFDLTGWFARTGILDMMHDKDVPPTVPAGGVGDHATAMTLFAGIMVALYKRDRTGEGSMVSTSLVGTGAWANGLNLMGSMAGLDGPTRRDQEGWSNPLQNVYATQDGRYVLISVQNIKRDFPKFANLLNREEWLQDETMQPVKPLFRNRFEARKRIAAAVAELPAEEFCRRLDEVGIVYSLIAQNREVLEDPQLHANDIIVPFDSGVPHMERTFATPFKLTDEPQSEPQRAPRIGEHSRQILAQYGFSGDEVERLIGSGVVSAED